MIISRYTYDGSIRSEIKNIHYSDEDFEINSKIYSFNLRLVLKHTLHSQDDFFRNLLFTLLVMVFVDAMCFENQPRWR